MSTIDEVARELAEKIGVRLYNDCAWLSDQELIDMTDIIAAAMRKREEAAGRRAIIELAERNADRMAHYESIIQPRAEVEASDGKTDMENKIVLLLAEEINGGCLVPVPLGYDKFRPIARRIRALLARAPRVESEATWRCFHCGFETSDNREAEAHFGDGDGEEALCKAWSELSREDRLEELQSTIMQLNIARDEHAEAISRAEAAEAERDRLLRIVDQTKAVDESFARLTAERDRLREFIDRWADHSDSCASVLFNGEPCDCGFDQALLRAETPESAPKPKANRLAIGIAAEEPSGSLAFSVIVNELLSDRRAKSEYVQAAIILLRGIFQRLAPKPKRERERTETIDPATGIVTPHPAPKPEGRTCEHVWATDGINPTRCTRCGSLAGRPDPLGELPPAASDGKGEA